MRILMLALVAFGAVARAQPIPETAFTSAPLERALEESKRTSKVVVVYARGTGAAFDLMEETTWKNPTLAAWIKWHGVALRVSRGEDASGWSRLERDLAEKSGNPGRMRSFPHVFFYVNGRLAEVYPDPIFHKYFFENPLGFRDGGPSAATFYPKAVQLLFWADLMMDQLRSRNAVWVMQHEKDNPEPAAPVIPPLSGAEGKDAPAVKGPDATKGEDVLSMLDLARRQVNAHEYYDATGTYTWLWERGVETEPSLGPALRSFVLAEMAALSDLRDGSRSRLLAIRKNMEARQPWWEYTDILDWMVVSEAAKLSQESVSYLAAFTLDDQEATMLPRADRAAYAMLASREPFSDPRRIGAKDPERLGKLLAAVRSTMVPKEVPAEEWAGVVALRRRMFEDEACRLYAASLARGDTGQASRVAAMLLGMRDDGPARLMLVMTAAVAGAPGTPDHSKWIWEAAEMGSRSAALDRRYAGAPAGPPAR